MKAHTTGFKNAVKELGRQLRAVITYGNVTLEEEIYAVTPHFEGGILKSVMKQLDLELSVDIPLETVLNCQIGILVNDSYEMLNFGNYVVYKSEKQEDTNTYKLTCYDKILYSMKQNEQLNITYPITIKNYLNAIANKIGLILANGSFYNQDMQIPSELYLGLEYTYRDILDEIAQATGSIITLNENDEIEVRYPTNTNDTIDEEFLKDVNVEFGKKYGVINSIVLSRSGESDNVYLRDEASVAQNGLTEVKIVDNQIMNFNNRSDYLQGILNALNGLYYYINDFNSTGILYYDVGDLYNIQVGENTYQCLMLNDEINVTTGIEEIIYTDMPEQSETDYTKADKTDMKINKTYLIVDKQNQQIESVINTVTTQNNKISQITQTVDDLTAQISDIADITTYGESDRANVELLDVNESEPIMIKVHPTSTNISYLYPHNGLYPSELQYIPNRIIRFTRTYEQDGETLTENIDYLLPDDLLRYSDTVYDEFYLNYESQTCQIIKRCAYNANGTVRALGTEITTDYSYPTIILGKGNYTITLPGYDFGYLYARLMAKNIYTTQFYTKVETNSKINQKADEINLGVNQTLTNYSTTNQMNSAITLKANEITSTVASTYETKFNAESKYSQLQQTDTNISSTVATKVGNNEIISKINQSSEAVQINANKINLSGKTINLTSDNIKIASNNFNVDKNGNMTCNSANITGGKFNVIAPSANTDTLKITSSSNSNDYMYASPAMVHLNGSEGKAELIAKSAASDHSYLVLSSGSGADENLTLTEKGINCRNIYDNVTTSNVPNMQIGSNGEVRRSTNTSTKKHKKDIKEVENIELNPKRLYKLPIKQFKYKEKYQPNKNDFRYNKDLIGFIAEDVAEIYPIATDYNEDGKVENWNERYMIPAMLKLIQEQHIEIEQMKKEIEELKGGNK